ncbi:hypothetical protein NFC81_07405 [Salinispirillum sp. LH 10-3-1]|uniref:LemA family protein n=1 Tax=Salinispirillum sp. LH 10-3-1 TaxID=2952525 RepID=A0AB38YJV3_9GAMM
MLWFLALFVFLMILVGALWMGQLSTDRFQEDVQRKQRAGLLKRRCVEIEELTTSLLRYDNNENLVVAITEFLISEIKKRHDLMPDDPDIPGELERAQHRIDNVSELVGRGEVHIPTNDFEIDELRKEIGRILKLIKVMYPQGFFLEEDFMAHTNRMKTLLLKTEINAYVQQGKVALKLGDRLTAASYFKHAKEKLVASEQSFPERTDMVKRISKMISSIYSTEKEFDSVTEAMQSGRFDLNLTGVAPDQESNGDANNDEGSDSTDSPEATDEKEPVETTKA